MKLIEYKCECGFRDEQIFDSTEEIPDTLICSKCKGVLKKTLNLKNNCHRERIMDSASTGTSNPLRGLGSRKKYNG